MDHYKRFGALSSSEDPQKLADTVKGVIVGLSGLIIIGLHLIGIDIGSAQVSSFASEAAIAISSIWTGYGLIKKFIIWFQTAWSNRVKG